MVKRLIDILMSSFGLIILSPLIIFLLFIAKLDTHSSGLFSQERIGLNGKKFRLYKIRTMRINTKLKTVVTTQSDIRITSVGAKLRKFKLDELPQLWNVFIGDMSLVGPRPEVRDYVELIPKDKRKIILSVRPGITGPASIKYRDEEIILDDQTEPERYNKEVIFPDKINININYIENLNFFSDIYYIFKTIFN